MGTPAAGLHIAKLVQVLVPDHWLSVLLENNTHADTAAWPEGPFHGV